MLLWKDRHLGQFIVYMLKIVVIKNQELNLIFQDKNLNDFRKKIEYIRSLSEENLQKIAKNAYETSKKFTWEKRAEKIISFVEEIEK